MFLRDLFVFSRLIKTMPKTKAAVGHSSGKRELRAGGE